MKYFLILILICFTTACKFRDDAKTAEAVAILKKIEKDAAIQQRRPPPVVVKKGTDTLYTTGDFNGDRRRDTAYAFMSGTPTINSPYEVWNVRFTSGSLPDLKPIDGRTRIINEGDLDYNGTDELSLFSESIHDCSLSLTTFTIEKGKWVVFTGPRNLGMDCSPLTDEDLQKRLVLENDTLIFWRGERTNNVYRLDKVILRTREYYTME